MHIFNIKKFESISSNGSRDIGKSLKISFGSSFVSLRAFGSKFWQFPEYIFQTKKTALDYLYPFLSFSVHNFFARTDGRTDSFLFSYWSRIYIHVYTYLDYFSNITPILTKVSIPFFSSGNGYENNIEILDFKIQNNEKFKNVNLNGIELSKTEILKFWN